jgi:hypothetical protein
MKINKIQEISDMPKKVKRGRGRPKTPDDLKKKTVTVSLRVPVELKGRIERDAEQQGKSANKEMADRLERSRPNFGYIDEWVFGDAETHNVMRLIGMMVRNIRNAEGGELWNNPKVHGDLKEAIVVVLDALGPDGGVPTPSNTETDGERRGRSWLNQVRTSRGKQIDKFPTANHVSDEYALEVICDCIGRPLLDRLEADK